MKTLIIGSYGNSNVGEEAVLMAILKRFQNLSDVTVTSVKPFKTEALHGVKSLTLADTEISGYDKVIVGGCGLFYGDCSRFSSRILEAYNLGIPVQVLNVDMGPVADSCFREVREALRVANEVSFRASFAQVILEKGMGIKRDIKIEEDISCTLNVPSCEESLKEIYGKGPYLGLSLKNIKIYYPNLIREIKKYLLQGYTIVPILNAWSDWPERQDVIGFHRLEVLMKSRWNKWCSPILSPLATMGIIREMDLIIAHTVHTTLWGKHFGKKVISIVPQNYFHQLAFKDLGASEFIFSTPPGYVEYNQQCVKYHGIKWKEIMEVKK